METTKSDASGTTADHVAIPGDDHKDVLAKRVYYPPQLVIVGRATALVQSYSSGKYSDGYTGYYWER